MSTPSTILVPASLSLNNNNKPSHDLGSLKAAHHHHHHGLHTQQHHHQQQYQHTHVLGGRSAADATKILSFSSSSMGVGKYAVKPGMLGLGSMLSTPLTPLTSPIASSVVEADAKQQQLLKDSLTADLKLLLHEFERFQQATAAAAGTGGVGEEEAAERSTKVEFFLGYIERVLQDLAGADATKLQELEVQIKTSLLPLKGKVVSQLAAQKPSPPPQQQQSSSSCCHPSSSCSSSLPSSSASVSSVHTTPPGSPLSREKMMMLSSNGTYAHTHAAVAASSSCAASRLMPPVSVRRDDSDISGITSCSDASSSCEEEGGAGHLDDLDLECFSLIMDDDAAVAPAPTAGTEKEMPRNGSFYDDDMTDAGSLTSEESTLLVPSPRESSSSSSLPLLSTIGKGLNNSSGKKRALSLETPSSNSSSCSSSLTSVSSLSLATESYASINTLQQPLKRARSIILPTTCNSSSSSSSSSSSNSSIHTPSSSSSTAAATVAVTDASKPFLRQVEYQCGACADTYTAASSLNPWWALEQQECPKCKKIQIPRIDITLPANTMDYHPALLAEEGDDDDDDEVGGGREGEMGGGMLMMPGGGEGYGHLEEGEEGGVGGVNGVGMCVPEEDEEAALSPAQASQLLSLLSHARTCPGHHVSEKHQAVCKSAKYLMLHVRDCDGKTLDGEACGFSWCRPCKHLLGHLVRCYEAEKCQICCSSTHHHEEEEEEEEVVSVEEEEEQGMEEEEGMRLGSYRSLTSLS